MKLPLRIALLGPESCGKTTLASALAARLAAARIKSCVVPEFARDYYASRAYQPTPEAVLAIAQGQLAAEQAAQARGAMVLLCDSTVLTCLIWAEVAFGNTDANLQKLYQPQAYALTLLCCPDIPWEPDPLRSHPHERLALLERYQARLARDQIPAVEIRGEGAARLASAWAVLQPYVAGLPKF